ncbi:MAG TPA: hypothetical protein VJA19_15330 [Pseudomonas sp.]|nr:hypothetical protein [Pseudomonas sp.]
MQSAQYKEGDKVTAVISRSAGRGGISLSARECKFVSLHPKDPNYAMVQMRNGRQEVVKLDAITPVGQRNALTRSLCGEE